MKTLGFLVAMAVAAQISAIAAPSPLCGEVDEHEGCWMPIEDMQGCHAWRHSHIKIMDAKKSLAWEGDGECVNGLLHGDGKLTERTEYPDGDWFEHAWAGSVVAGKRDGVGTSTSEDWTGWRTRVELHVEDGQVQNQVGAREEWDGGGTHRSVNAVGGRWHGPFRETYGGEARGGHQTDGQYVENNRDGRWETTYGDGGTRVFHYEESRLRGPDVHVSPNGERWQGEWRKGSRYEGKWAWLKADGSVAISATFVGAEVTELETPGVRLAEGTPPAQGRAPINGAFGINFGPAGMGQLTTLTCFEPSIIHDWPQDIWPEEREEVSCATALLEDESWIAFGSRLEIKQPPRPIAGGQRYYVRSNLEKGITEVSVIVGQFDSREPCEEEGERINEMLVGKYGLCKIFSYESWLNVVGQCDGKGLAERRVKADCDQSADDRFFVNLEYEIVAEDQRRATAEEWLRDGKPSADDL